MRIEDLEPAMVYSRTTVQELIDNLRAAQRSALEYKRVYEERGNQIQRLEIALSRAKLTSRTQNDL